MTHPQQLHAVAALWSLRAASRYLDAHREAAAYTAATPTPSPVRQRSLRALGAFDTLLRQERAERAAAAAAGLKPSAGLRAPISPGLLDAAANVAQATADARTLLGHVHRTQPLHGPWPAAPDPWGRLALDLVDAPPGVAAELTRLLDAADRHARTLCQVGPDWLPLATGPRCPTCGERRLRLQASAPEWRWRTVTCTNPACLCTGPGQPGAGDACPCTMPERAVGVRHIWWETDAPTAATEHERRAA